MAEKLLKKEKKVHTYSHEQTLEWNRNFKLVLNMDKMADTGSNFTKKVKVSDIYI